MAKKELTCINCPVGCNMTVEVDEDNNMISITGNSCGRGKIYAATEVKDPRRIVCSTVHIDGSNHPLISVKTKEAIPKNKIFDVMAEVQKAKVQAPVAIGDVIIPNVAGTGIDLVATENRSVK